MTDNVNRPQHYAEGWSNGAEVIDITENLNFNRGNAVKYLARAGKKNASTELEDLRKARWYLDREIGRLEDLNNPWSPDGVAEQLRQMQNEQNKRHLEWTFVLGQQKQKT